MNKIIGNILIGLVIIACLPIVLPKLFGIACYNVISGSMEPTISVGSIVYVREADFADIKEGDIIAFESGASVVTHRVDSIDEKNQLFVTKGDANEVVDFSPVAYTNIIGKVRCHFPLMGNIAAWLSKTEGKIVAGLILLVGVVLSSFSRKKHDSGENGEAIQQTSKKRRVNPKAVLVTGLVIVFGSLGGLIYIYSGYQKANNLYSQLRQEYVVVDETPVEWYEMVDVNIVDLQAINEDVIAWIYVEGTDISYPILYSGDDEKYLRTTLENTQATAGSIFLEGYNLPDFSDSHNIIYGHNMRNLSMFGMLRYYKADENYLDEHKYFQIITADGKYRYEIFSYFDTDPASWVYAVPYSDCQEFEDYIGELKRHSYKKIDTEKEVSSKDKITTLSTCSTSGMRFTVHGYMVDSYKTK